MKNLDFASLDEFNFGSLSQNVMPLSKSGQIIPIESARYESIKSETAPENEEHEGFVESMYCCEDWESLCEFFSYIIILNS